ncbi:MAG: hypothetical protein MJB14_13920 [Spirochaetes bacterium]|nr:hypothetical protein [Spirochaetota bacterium]
MKYYHDYIDGLIKKGFEAGFKDKKTVLDFVSLNHEKAVNEVKEDPVKLKRLLDYYYQMLTLILEE